MGKEDKLIGKQASFFLSVAAASSGMIATLLATSLELSHASKQFEVNCCEHLTMEQALQMALREDPLYLGQEQTEHGTIPHVLCSNCGSHHERTIKTNRQQEFQELLTTNFIPTNRAHYEFAGAA